MVVSRLSSGVFFFYVSLSFSIQLFKLLPSLLEVVRNFPMLSVCSNFVFFACLCDFAALECQ